MPAAYKAAAGDGHSSELALLGMVERFGAGAVMGREVLYSYEIRRMMLAEAVRDAYHERGKALNWVEWTSSNPHKADLLARAEKMAEDT